MEKLRGILSALSKPRVTESELRLAEYILAACPDIRAKVGIDELRKEISQNTGEYAGKLSPSQVERLCSFRRDLAKYEDDNDI